jgi:hypothetical protein
LEAVHAGRTSGFVFESEMHAFMPAVLLRIDLTGVFCTR